ncbi:conserved protein, unknown function [Hepatocystis sp. ex Piliocolobus tephrosceles]|nr:conserved protein, unknown function [Hepatocystis sp. ex Piliocolobus tephrosceles]
MNDNDEENKKKLIQELSDYKKCDSKFPEVLRSYITKNVPDENNAESFFISFDDTYLKKMNLDELELMCFFILKKKNIKVASSL